MKSSIEGLSVPEPLAGPFNAAARLADLLIAGRGSARP